MLMAACVLAVIVAVIGIFGSGESDEIGFPSSYNTGRRGGKAAYLLLKQSGYNINRWDEPPSELSQSPQGTLLIIADPRRWPEASERDALQKFVATGGRLLLAGGSFGEFAANAHVGRGEFRPAGSKCDAIAPTGLTRGGSIAIEGSAAWSGADVSQVVHYACKKDAVVVSYAVGKGEVIWWAGAQPLTNAGIREEHNLDLLVNSIGDARQVLWDEYFFGATPGPWSYAVSNALKWAALDCGVLVVFILVTFARRSGPLMPLAAESRLSPLEFVETLGKLYEKAGAAQAAVEIATGRFRQLLARRSGLRGQCSVDEMARAIQARHIGLDADFAATLRRCEDAAGDPGLTQKEALALVQQLNDGARKLQLISAEFQEKRDGSNSAGPVARPQRAEQGNRRAAGVH
jgi:hypothetical protein